MNALNYNFVLGVFSRQNRHLLDTTLGASYLVSFINAFV